MDAVAGTPNVAPVAQPDGDRDARLWSLAQDLEASFLSEMLKTAGVGKAPEGFGGGAGEDQFSSFLVHEYASATVRAGGIGLSEAIYRSLVTEERKAP
ncbi:MAG: rod-binding protein [Silicimonas sp.]|nr:rod-binding protein [Silicimonas sp.]NNF92450.1 flagellar biosynthesis protein FlgJ [Boseongicola sp.]RZW08526.1 MAG: flagellar biosynthesis protein FlgJ [Paracoccaceae bacterium]MBT8426207.1 rod-binding protein [Silicimonas sp.]NND17135.1 flagellar biosynthesis protein FlgJ [Silicimonas sp.]